jgi:hypothetical protein
MRYVILNRVKNLALSEHKGRRCFADLLAEFVLREAEGLRASLTTIGEDHDRRRQEGR